MVYPKQVRGANNDATSQINRNTNQGQPNESWSEGYIPSNEIETKITEKTIQFAEKFGEYLAKDPNKMTTNQLRKFFGEVKRLQMIGYEKGQTDFILLQPKLAYAVGRAVKGGKNRIDGYKINDFCKVISDGICRVKNAEQFRNFIKIFEAIVAYHKQYSDEK